MKTLVLYDSVFGFTEKIAQAIGSGIAGEVKVARFGEVSNTRLEGYDLIFFGSPTQGGRMLKPVQAYLDGLPESSLKGQKTAAFDTRLTAKWVKIFGYAANKIDAVLRKKGAVPVIEPEGFFVKSAKGPLVDGEEDRAKTWAYKIATGR